METECKHKWEIYTVSDAGRNDQTYDIELICSECGLCIRAWDCKTYPLREDEFREEVE